MATQVQIRRGTNTQNASFTGAEGELSANTTNDSVHVHDGSTAGGFELARADLNNVSDTDLNAALTGNTLASLTITSADINGGNIDGTVIGGTTAAAGSFTTGAFSGAVTAQKLVSTDGVLELDDNGSHNGIINSPASLFVNIDSDNGSTGEDFVIGKDRTSTSGGTELFRVQEDGNVGIGTESPHSSGTSFTVLNLNGTKGGSLAFSRGTNSATKQWAIRTSDDEDLRFEYGSTLASEAMRIKNDGKIGMGQTNPLAHVHIKTSTNTPLLLESTSGGGGYVEYRLGASGAVLGYLGSANELIASGSSSDLGIRSQGAINFATGGSTERMKIASDGTTTFSIPLMEFGASGGSQLQFFPAFSTNVNLIQSYNGSAYTTEEHRAGDYKFKIGTGDAVTIDSSGNVLAGTTDTSLYNNTSGGGINLMASNRLDVARAGDVVATFNRMTNDGSIIQFYAQGALEGSIDVSGSTVSLVGFSGAHASSGVDVTTAKGTIVSTIDQEHKSNHAKIKVSDSEGDARVYGVIDRISEEGDIIVSGVGIGEVKVTGACAGGDLLESNGDGTAKVQSDDIIRSKTIGKVTIGNSDEGVKLVSCVLYCG